MSIKTPLRLLLFLVLIYFPIFLHLERLPIRLWDESRLAANAWEMSQNGNFLVTYFDGAPDMWNTKPPLLIWLQVLCIKILGLRELSIRLPSAIAAFLTVSLILSFSIRYLKDFWFGMIATLVLVTSYGYIDNHVTRTGDYDSMLILFTTAYSILFFAYTETRRIAFLHLFFLSLTLAVLTKSIQALLFVPSLLFYLIFSKQMHILRTKWFFIDMFLSFFTISTYYLLREYYNPGYIRAVWENEIGGRYLTIIEEHKGSFLFYFDMLVKHHYADWYWLVPCGVAIGFFVKEEKVRKLCLFSSLLVVTYWLIISSAKTKLEWYSAPMYPFLALIVAIFIHTVFKLLINMSDVKDLFRYNVVPFVFIFIVFLHPYQKIIDKVYFPQEYEWDRNLYTISYFLQSATKSEHNIDAFGVCYEGYSPQINFYINMLNNAGKNIVRKDWNNLQPGEKIIASQHNIQQFIEENYSHQVVGGIENVKKYLIYEKKGNN